MILAMKKWCEGLIVTLIIAVIIEMLIPEGQNKKYIKVIIGIYIIFVTITPILDLFNYKFDFDDLFSIKTDQTYSSIDEQIKDVYVVGIEQTIKQEIETLGFNVNSVKIFTDSEYENIEKIEISLLETNEFIEPIVIGNTINTEKYDYSKIIEHLKNNYFIKEENIIFW